MKTVDHMLCASQASLAISQASAAICRMENVSHSSSSSSSSRLGGRAIDRHNPIIRDGRRSSLASQNANMGSPSCGKTPKKQNNKNSKNNNNKLNSPMWKKRSGGDGGVSPMGDSISTPPGSTRYLLADPVFFDGLHDSDPIPIPIEAVDDGPIKSEEVIDFDEDRLIMNASKPHSSSSFLEQKEPVISNGLLDFDPVMPLDYLTEDTNKTQLEAPIQTNEKVISEPKSKSSSFSENKPPSDQTVVLRASLHCKGCAGKVKKHLSRMQGVTAFNVDFAAKKVTVTGDVTPLGVLASVSKVKNAQFWTDVKK